MAILDLSKIKSSKDLEERSRKDLEGKSLSKIASWIQSSDSISRVSSKAGVGDLIEQGYFGIPRNNHKGPDIPSLGIEVKTSPLKIGKDGKLRVKEPLSLNIINYNEEHSHHDIRESSLYKKNQKVLFVWYIHDKSLLRSKYVIKYVFLWKMNDKVIAELNPDYKKIIKEIKNGKAHHIHQGHHDYLTLCPKHGGKFKDPSDTKSKTKQPFSSAPAEVRAYRLKNSYMNTVIRRYLASERPKEIDDFIRAKVKKPNKK